MILTTSGLGRSFRCHNVLIGPGRPKPWTEPKHNRIKHVSLDEQMLLCVCACCCYVTLDIDFVSSAILSESCHFGFHLIVYARNFVISSVNSFSGHANFSLSFFSRDRLWTVFLCCSVSGSDGTGRRVKLVKRDWRPRCWWKENDPFFVSLLLGAWTVNAWNWIWSGLWPGILLILLARDNFTNR